MFFGNNGYGASKPARRKGDTRIHVAQDDHQVRAQVEHKFSVMDQEHARIRAEALATSVPDNRGPGLMAKRKTA